MAVRADSYDRGVLGHAARRRRIELPPYLLILPIALLLVAISFYPSLSAVWLAMTDTSLLRLAQVGQRDVPE